ncbi:succinate dehydrogenase cytochrome b subunit [Halobacteriovorax sp. XZX-3]|uniref:succinate dehydrogenase cytochrome b subunit n=1 Tax=unclassified Halobacteriovorax TaxID=2639665 RepID=UPI000CD215CB|nr:succinate dehydrogenase cytochrome b subunit [Halobacteriovorax sp. DA5]POB13830.1 succinate dehydrogenase [Halobacteriovorax sp. DA5]
MLFFRKYILAFTGLFLCLFLIVHLGGNLILLLPKFHAQSLYNLYSHTLAENLLIKVVSIFLYLAILIHTYMAVRVTIKNSRSQGVDYAFKDNSEVTTWTSQNMGLLGFIILIFIVVHMGNFWARVKLGFGQSIPIDSSGHKDIYLITTQLFKNPFYVIFYSLLMIPLGAHINHGLSSAFKTLGFYRLKHIQVLDKCSRFFSLIITFGFAIIPIVIFIREKL